MTTWVDNAAASAQGDAQRLALTAYPVAGATGAVVICPGGGYTHLAPHEGEPIARMLNAAGISAYVLLYSLAPCPHDAPMTEAQCAVRQVRAMGYARVGVLGFSAGGHVACMAALCAPDDARPDALIACYPVVTMGEGTHEGSRRSLLGDGADDPAMRWRYSAEAQVTPDAPPAFIWHTAADATVPVDNSLRLAAAYSRCGVPFALHIFPTGRHGLGLAEEEPLTCQWPALCCAWLREQGFAKA